LGVDDKRTARLTIRLSPALRKRLDSAAAADHRKPSSLAVIYIEQGIARAELKAAKRARKQASKQGNR
jgi:predicted transcriptional regulator